MKVILIEDIPSLGKMGDLVKVADGYGRNFLVPHGKAIRATTHNVKVLEHQTKQLKNKVDKIKRDAEKLARKIEAVSCTVAKPAGDEEKIFGSVTSMDIGESLKVEGIEVDRKNIILDEPIKTLGIYTVPIKLHPEVTAQLKVWVVKT
ncbi:MAG: 50S ribosomal protein L9 [Deltaproteobacteria bacterium]|nr:50S ribosomal protein L9 [Deltaproteobacteria bacterium]